MRCLGARQPQLLRMFIGEFALLGLAASVAAGRTGAGAEAVYGSVV